MPAHEVNHMPLPTALLAACKTKRFWTDYLWFTEAGSKVYPKLAKAKVGISLPCAYRLALSLADSRAYCSLPSGGTLGGPAAIGWDDQADCHPHVIRWDELDAIRRFAGEQASPLPHPGILLLLLYRCAPICVGD